LLAKISKKLQHIKNYYLRGYRLSSNEKAEAVIIILKRILKWVLITVISVIALIYIAAKVGDLIDWYTEGRHKDKVSVITKFDKKLCEKKEHPLFIGIINNSTKTIVKTTVYVKVTKNGYSSQLNNSSAYYEDKIINANDGWGNCWSIIAQDYRTNLNGEGMDVVVDFFNVTFKK
jgi:hypothetical protein